LLGRASDFSIGVTSRVTKVLENRTAAASTPSPLRAVGADLPKQQRARRTNDPLAGIETNTARGRRIADLVRAYLRAVGNPVDIERQAAVIAAAELQVLAEEARAAALKQAGTCDLDRVVRIEGAAARAVKRLGIGRARQPAQTGLAGLLVADRARGHSP